MSRLLIVRAPSEQSLDSLLLPLPSHLDPGATLCYFDNFADATYTSSDWLVPNPALVGTGPIPTDAAIEMSDPSETCPHFGGDIIRLDYPIRGGQRGFNFNAGTLCVNQANNDDSIVYQISFREVGTGSYDGKVFDTTNGGVPGGGPRLDFNDGTGQFGEGDENADQDLANRSDNPFCNSDYYTPSTFDAVTPNTLRDPGPKGNSGSWYVATSQFRLRALFSGAAAIRTTYNPGNLGNWALFFNMNMATYDWFSNPHNDLSGSGLPWTLGQQKVFTFKWTKSLDSDIGNGRQEVWMTQGDGTTTKRMQWLGDQTVRGPVYGHVPGHVFSVASTQTWFAGLWNIFNLPGGGTGLPAIMLGGFRMFRHPRIDIS